MRSSEVDYDELPSEIKDYVSKHISVAYDKIGSYPVFHEYDVYSIVEFVYNYLNKK
jgi:hypothetical protein